MKKRKIRKITASGILAGTVMASSAFIPGCNRPTSVYGPPPEYEPDENLPVGVYGPPQIEEDPAKEEYDPSENINEDVYGPPEFYEEENQQ